MSTTTLSSVETVRDEQGRARKMTYAAPTLTVYGRMDRLTKATKAFGSQTDGQYNCKTENGGLTACYS